MEHLELRQNNPQYLKNVIQQRNITIEEQQRKNKEYQKQISNLQKQLEQCRKIKLKQQKQFEVQIVNLKMALQQFESQIDQLKNQKTQTEFGLNLTRMKLQEQGKEYQREIDRLKMELTVQKDQMSNKISKLQKNLNSLKEHYKVDQGIKSDKRTIIEDSNRDLRGFSNEKQERMIILQNQQLSNEVQYQSKQIISMLEKNEKQQQQLKSFKIQLQLHKEIENDLVKRSSLAQTLIRQLNKKIRQLQKYIKKINLQSTSNNQIQSEQSYLSQKIQDNSSQKDLLEAYNKLKFQNASLQNYNHYLENMQKVFGQKYQTLGSIMAEYLENIMFMKGKSSSERGLEDTSVQENLNQQIVLNIPLLKEKHIKEWSTQELETVIYILIAQIKPYLSKNSLTAVPQPSNVNISFVEEASKEAISLPKITGNYQKVYDKQVKKVSNRFQDIPIDISTKILRSNLRQWGTKINYGSMPRTKKQKSIRLMNNLEKSVI